MIVNTNVNAMVSLNFGRLNNLVMAGRMERLSTARKVNRGADDPSGLAILTSMKARANGERVANQNAQDAISFLQLRDSAMAEVGDMLLRLRDLAVRASNEAPMTDADRRKLSDEAAVLIKTIDTINRATEFNNKRVFDLSFETVEGGVLGFYTGGIKTMSIDLASIYASTGNTPVTIRAAWFDGALWFPDLNLISPDGTEAFGWLYSPNNFAPGADESSGIFRRVVHRGQPRRGALDNRHRQ